MIADSSLSSSKLMPQGSAAHKPCPRCSALLGTDPDDGFPRCVACGYYDYSPALRVQIPAAISRFRMIRYHGPDIPMKDIVVKARLRRIGEASDAALIPICPWCGEEMTTASLSGKRREPNEVRYEDTEGHRLSVLPQPVSPMRYWWLPSVARRLAEQREKADLIWR